jgi:hypothetical protein
MERETGIEPATNSLEGCDSTTELLPPTRSHAVPVSRSGGASPPSSSHASLPQLRVDKPAYPSLASPSRPHLRRRAKRGLPPIQQRHQTEKPLLPSGFSVWWGGEGSNLRSPKAAGLQPAAIDHSATSPHTLPHRPRPRWIQPANGRHRRELAQIRFVCVCGMRFRDVPDGRQRVDRWSWRRDLNPRPADYKSAALPD